MQYIPIVCHLSEKMCLSLSLQRSSRQGGATPGLSSARSCPFTTENAPYAAGWSIDFISSLQATQTITILSCAGYVEPLLCDQCLSISVKADEI